jgi:hypothetical protein
MGNNQNSISKKEKLFLKHGIYRGETTDGLPDGVGMLSLNSGDILKGTFSGGKLQKGRCLYKNQDFYIGEW